MGCGCGLLVYAAAFLGGFAKVVGTDNLNTLLERGERRASRWDIHKLGFTDQVKKTTFEWIEEDILVNSFWRDSSFLFLHWSAFSYQQRQTLASMMGQLNEGTQVISLTSPIPGDDFEVLVTDSCVTSWGKADYFFQEKITAARR